MVVIKCSKIFLLCFTRLFDEYTDTEFNQFVYIINQKENNKITSNAVIEKDCFFTFVG